MSDANHTNMASIPVEAFDKEEDAVFKKAGMANMCYDRIQIRTTRWSMGATQGEDKGEAQRLCQ
eukprot:9649205-Karenia_brevis.AAC.1